MFEEIITRLLQGQFICEASAPSLFRQFDTESYRDEVDQYLSRINRRLSVTPNRQAYYATWKRVGPDQRAEAKRVMANIKQVLHPIVKFLALCMDCQGTDIAPSPGARETGNCRVVSPSGPSTLITSAPWSARICVQNGPISTAVRSSTRSP